jgi:hypothetical protein
LDIKKEIQMNKPSISTKITGAMPHCSGPNKVPDSGVEDNSFGNRSGAPKDSKLLSKDSMGNKNLTEHSSPSKGPGVDKSFLGKAKNDMTKTGSL